MTLFLLLLNLLITTFDWQHKPAPKVKVFLQSLARKQVITGETDANGTCRFTVPVGDYTLRAEGANSLKTIHVGTAQQQKEELTLDPPFSDEPFFTVAGVTDNTYRGGHGADTVLRSTEDLSKATAALAEKQDPKGDPLAAVHTLQKAAEQNPSEPNLFDLGTELLSHRAPEPAIQVLLKGVRLFPQSVRMLLGLAAANYAAGSYEQAAAQFFQATDIHPDDTEPYLFLAKVQARQITQTPGYRERFIRFAKLQPQNPLANYYCALALPPGDPDVSKLLDKAIALDPHLAPAYLQLGILAASNRNYTQAIAGYQKAIAESPDLEEAHFRLSEAYRLTGDRPKAAQELAAYQELSKKSAEKREQNRRQIQQFVVNLKAQ